jgi:AraC family transcriptional regulator
MTLAYAESIEAPQPRADVTETSSAGRAAITVSCLFPSQRESVRNAIEILIPRSRAAFYASFPGNRRGQHVLVREPFVSVIPAHQPHVIDGLPRSDVIVIILDQVFYERRVREATGCAAPELVRRDAALDPFIREIGNSLHREFQERGQPSDAYLKSLAAVLAVHVARNYQSVGSSSCTLGVGPEKLSRVQAFVSDHLERELSVQQLAAVVHMSPFHFARRFKQATGYTPHNYVTLQRMERSKEMLRESDVPLVDVAFDVGFKTQGHFTVVFHKAVGMTPRAYRLLNRRPSGHPRVVHGQVRMARDRLAE